MFERYDGTCIKCLTPTDSALQFLGPIEWCAAGLLVLGLFEEEAELIVARGARRYGRKHQPSKMIISVRACQSCAEKVGFTVAVAVPGQTLPTYVCPEQEAS